MSVDEFLNQLDHPRKDEIVALRAAIVASDPSIVEEVKWNAPSFDDRVTMRLAPKGQLGLILHRGAKVRPDDGFAFEDDTGLVEWKTSDRGVVTIDDLGEQLPAVVDLVGRWLRATRSE